MKKLFSLLFISSLLLSYSVSAETTTSKVPLFQYDVYGFVRNDFTYDSRKTLGAVSELINFMPLQPEYNAFGEDLNAIPSTRYLAITTRLGLNINSTQKVLGAYAGAKIETDFCGYSVNTTMLRIRQAYFTLNWKQAVEENPLKQQLLLGQTWHPFSITMMPDILSLNAGSPFNPFNRSPMIRYKLMKSGFDFTAAAIWQFQYASVGPLGASDSYLNYSMVPELYLGVDYLFSGFKIGLGAEYVRISPRELAEVTLPNGETTKVRVNESLNTFNALLYIGYHCQNFNVKAKSVFGQNSSHLLNMTGYGVIEEYENGNRAYAPLMSSSSWISLSYNIKKSYQVSLFGGYMKNFGSHSLFTSLDDLYVRGSKNLDQLFRFTPSFVYRPKFGNGFHKLEAGIEYELTGAFYGNASTFYGIPSNVELTMNNRINVILVYNFGN